MSGMTYIRLVIKTGMVAFMILCAGVSIISAQKNQILAWQADLNFLRGVSDRELTRNEGAVAHIRRGVELWIKLHPSIKIPLEPAPPEPWGIQAMRSQVSLLHAAVQAILREDSGQPFDIGQTTIRVEGLFEEKDFVGPMFTETNTKTKITENGINAIGPTSKMSVARAINLIPSVSQQSVDPIGLADISNYHESYRFRGIEPTGGGNPSTPVNVENVPVSGRPGGGANIYDLENFESVSIYKGGIPADKGFGLTNIGGKIDLEVKRPEETFRIDLKQALGSYGFRRSWKLPTITTSVCDTLPTNSM